jgi:hypothetical protein
MQWQQITDEIYQRYDEAGVAELVPDGKGGYKEHEDTLVFEYDVVIDSPIGPKVSGWEIDHDAQAIILKVGATYCASPFSSFAQGLAGMGGPASESPTREE